MEKEISPILRKMQISDTEVYPISKLNVLKTTASQLGAQLQRSYSTSIVRSKGVILVTRTA
jgi:hypothetical protein